MRDSSLTGSLVRPFANFVLLTSTGVFGFTPVFGIAKQVGFQFVFLAMFTTLSSVSTTVCMVLILLVHMLCCMAISMFKISGSFNVRKGQTEHGEAIEARQLFALSALTSCVLTGIIVAGAVAGGFSGEQIASFFEALGASVFAGAGLLLLFAPSCGFSTAQLSVWDRLGIWAISLVLFALAAYCAYLGGTTAIIVMATVLLSAATGSAINVTAVLQTLHNLKQQSAPAVVEPVSSPVSEPKSEEPVVVPAASVPAAVEPAPTKFVEPVPATPASSGEGSAETKPSGTAEQR